MTAARRLKAILAAVAIFAAPPARATFSIAAYDSVTQELGVAVQSRAFSVGMAVPWVEAGVGAIATQASTNRAFGPSGLALLRSGMPASEVMRALLDADSGSAHRQLGVVDAHGRSANFTGKLCSEWAGGLSGDGYAVQGNILAGEAVVKGMERAFLETRGELAERLLAALVAGQAAGGDRRGMESAALIVARPSESHPEYRLRYVDLRVEDHRDPITELVRVYRIHEAQRLAEAHMVYAEEYERAGSMDLARMERERVAESLQRALARKEASASTLNGLAWTCATRGLHLAEALEAAERAAKLEPKSAEILDTLAEVHFRSGNAAKAIEVETQALSYSPNDQYLKDQIARFKSATK
ncbi:MAG: DUF1028 domain-containing protein [Candidatus Latescibacteria bacterium]|nr:DUF1028 domain-containing protein [Candidatus Latescibacterota bacterium]